MIPGSITLMLILFLVKEWAGKPVEFRLGEIEALPVEDATVDVIISNCVIDLVPDKLKVFQEAYRFLKSGCRLMVSDLVTERRIARGCQKKF